MTWRCTLLLQVRSGFKITPAAFLSRERAKQIQPAAPLFDLWCLAKEPESAETDPTVAPPAPPSESTLLNGRNVTLVGERICWSDALLYCRRRHWDLLSLHSEEEQEQVVQMLSRSTFAITDGVWLGLRRYATPDQ